MFVYFLFLSLTHENFARKKNHWFGKFTKFFSSGSHLCTWKKQFLQLRLQHTNTKHSMRDIITRKKINIYFSFTRVPKRFSNEVKDREKRWQWQWAMTMTRYNLNIYMTERLRLEIENDYMHTKPLTYSFCFSIF